MKLLELIIQKKFWQYWSLMFQDKALYLFGFTNERKKIQANSSLLWNAIIDIKKYG